MKTLNIFQKVQEKIPYHTRQKIKYEIRVFCGFFYFFNLDKLALIHKTDKNSKNGHSYTKYYSNNFKKFKFKSFLLVEIGIGGYDGKFSGGDSLRMWKNYFPFSNILGIDIYDKSFHNTTRINTIQGNQQDSKFLKTLMKKFSKPSIIIDDGSHMNSHVISTFQILFEWLKDGGIYVIEDTQTSYWENWGGNSNNFNDVGTIMGYFKSLSDGLNHREIISPGYKATYFDLNIISIQFYHNLIFIFKGDNSEQSNAVIENRKLRFENHTYE